VALSFSLLTFFLRSLFGVPPPSHFRERELIVGPPGNPVPTRLRSGEKGKGAFVILLESPVPNDLNMVVTRMGHIAGKL
jgi:hypothetical protein